MKSFVTVFVFLAVCGAIGAADEDENPTRLLQRATQHLGQLPFGNVDRSTTVVSSVQLPAPTSTDLAVSRLRQKLKQIVDSLWSSLNDPQRFAILQGKGAKDVILKTFSELQGDVFAMSQKITESRIRPTLQSLNLNEEEMQFWTPTLESFTKATAKVDLLYQVFDAFQSQVDGVSNDALEDFANSVLKSDPGSTGDASVLSTLLDLHRLSVPQQSNRTAPLLGRTLRNDIFTRLKMILERQSNDHLCSMGQSPHQMIYNLYNVISLTEIKGYAMIQFSYMMLKLYGKGNFTFESDLARKNFEAQATDKLMAVKQILPTLSTEFWRCDPPQQIEGTTFEQLTELLQGYMENEVDMNTRGSCKESCHNYKVSKSEGCFKDLFCAKQKRCRGRMFDCQFFHADSWVCMSQDKRRRYDWIEYEDSTLLGDKGQCINKIKVDSWWRWLFWHCSYCLCKCDEPGPDSDRYWSLKPAVAKTSANMVVTGVRFVKRNRVMHLEIEEAVALPEGAVDPTTQAWVSADEMEISDKNEDLFEMSYEQRALDTDRLQAPPGHVVTGVRLRNLGGHLNLEIQVTPIKFSEGKLLPESSTWVGNDNTPATHPRRELVDILMPDVPTKYKGRNSVVDTKDNQYVLFDATSAHKDVMQTTIPFIDVQPVSPSMATWLSGVGLYHKGALGYGGYVGLMVNTFDFSRHLLPDAAQSGKDMKAELRYEFGTPPPK